jgi:plastocyanin
MRSLIVSAALVIVAGAWACGGGSGGYSTPTAPTPTGGGGGTTAGTTIAIVGDRGSSSFNPNPSAVSQGTTMAWKNTDSVTHHIVMNDGSLDTGDIPPGGTSAALTLATNGGNYHCTIHPGMVGSINSSTGAPPPCSGAYCDSSK